MPGPLLCRFVLLAAAGLPLSALGQDAARPLPNDATAENASKAAAFAGVEAMRYEIRRAGGKQETLKLLGQPVLRWSNPTDGEVYGSVMLWTSHGCPEAAASIYQFFDRKQINIELVSLSESSLAANRNGRLRWSPDPGVKFVPLPEGPAPAETTPQRHLQMRSLARRFTGLLADRDNEAKFSQLRLMSRPLHQYESTDGADREGAVFAFVTTTDPEILLILESRVTAKVRQWVYAAARMHYCRLQLKLDERVVWEVPRAAPPWDQLRGPQGEYVILEWPSVEAAAND
jgi:hypothetical protein